MMLGRALSLEVCLGSVTVVPESVMPDLVEGLY